MLKKLFKKLIPATIVAAIALSTVVLPALAGGGPVNLGWDLNWTCDARSVKVSFDPDNYPIHMGGVKYADGTTQVNIYEWSNGQHNSPYTYGDTGVPIVMIRLDTHPDTGGSDYPGYQTSRHFFTPVKCMPKIFKVYMWLYDPGTMVDGFACLVVNDTPTVPAPHRVLKLCGDFFAEQGFEGYEATAPVCGGPVTRNGWGCDYYGYSRFDYVKLWQIARRQPGDW